MKERYTFSIHGSPKIRLDRYLMEHLPKAISRSQLHRIFDEGKVCVDGKCVKPHHRILDGQTVELEYAPSQTTALLPEAIPLKIVFEDPHLLVIDKPAGMVVHPAAGNWTGTLVNALLHHARELSGVNGPLRPGIVHRLDKDTSGLLVCAKNDAVHKELAEQFEARTVGRTYVALVKGIVQFDEGVIDLPLGRSRRDRKKFAVRPMDGKKAVTYYEVLKRLKDFTVLRLKLGTGRTHQIRVHMASLGHPVVGDRTYGSVQGFSRQALHAETLSFLHPVTQKMCEFKSPIPEEMRRLIEKGSLR
ncbi:MAG: RluA family pseudouridine synthase [Candidatus Omnitrophota bacterium]